MPLTHSATRDRRYSCESNRLVRGGQSRLDDLRLPVDQFVTLGLVECATRTPYRTAAAHRRAHLRRLGVILVIAYSGLVVTIPRAGGDYVWQSRILGSGSGS